MDLSCAKPLGDPTTVLDLCDRDDQDDFLFPLDTNTSWFVRNTERRVLPFTTVIQEFPHKGKGTWGGKLQFELGNYKTCDLLFSVVLQIKLDHWFPTWLQEKLKKGQYVLKDPTDLWFYANSLGTTLIQNAEFQLEDQTLEVIDGDFANVFYSLFPDQDKQYGIATDALGIVSIPRLIKTNPLRFLPTEGGWISCILPFSFQRETLRNSFPVMSVKEKALRINITLSRFDQCVRSSKLTRKSCNDTPLGKTFTFIDKSLPYYQEETFPVPMTIPDFKSLRLVTYGSILDGSFRQALLHKPFDRIYRDVFTFRYNEPIKYKMIITSSDTVQVTLPLECNGPVEEILWFVRRKAVANNNEWTNYTNVLESEYNPVYNPFETLLIDAAIQIDGEVMVHDQESYFRRHISGVHKGGIVSYLKNIYGYSFAAHPGKHNPSGWFNASRANDVRLRLKIRPPGGVNDLEWEVVVFVMSMNWVRFQNGIANKVFSS